MATLPGLPMVGHGQIEGYTEKYGMEYRRAYFDERPDPWLVERHEREIVPLFRQRALFANVDDFLFFDLVRDDGTVDEDVFAYSNRGGGECSLVIYNNNYGSTAGRIRQSAPYAARTDDGGLAITQRTVGQGLGLHEADGRYVALRDIRSGFESLRPSRQVHADGLRVQLAGYECHVYLGIRELQDSEELPWGRLAADLGDRAVPSLDDAMQAMRLRPVRQAFARLVEPMRLDRLRIAGGGAESAADSADLAAILSDLDELAAAVRGQLGVAAPETTEQTGTREQVATELRRLVAVAAPPTSGLTSEPTAEPKEVVASTEGAPTRLAQPESPVADDPGSVIAPDWQPQAILGADPATWIAEVASPLLVALDALVGRTQGKESASGSSDGAGIRAREWLDRFELAPMLAETFRAAGEREAEAWRCVDGVRVLLVAPRWLLENGSPAGARRILEAWLTDPAAERFLQVNEVRGVRWFNRESFVRLVDWSAIAGLARTTETTPPKPIDPKDTPVTALHGHADPAFRAVRLIRERLVEAAQRSGYRVDGLLTSVEPEPDGATGERKVRRPGLSPARARRRSGSSRR